MNLKMKASDSFSESYDVVSKTIDTRRREFIRQLGSLGKAVPDTGGEISEGEGYRKSYQR